MYTLASGCFHIMQQSWPIYGIPFVKPSVIHLTIQSCVLTLLQPVSCFRFSKRCFWSNSPAPCEISLSLVFKSLAAFSSNSFACFSMFCLVLVDADSYGVRGLPVFGMHESGSSWLVSALVLDFWYDAAALYSFKKQLLQQMTVFWDSPISSDSDSHAASTSSCMRAGNGFSVCFLLGVLQPWIGQWAVTFHLHDGHILPFSNGLEFSNSVAALQTLHSI